jgi:hypothetical protein
VDDIVQFVFPVVPRYEQDCTMKTGWSTRRVAASLGIAAIISMGALTACGSEEKEAPSETSTTTTSTTSPSASPTEKAPRLDPNGPNPFSPDVKAPPAPTALPGDN